MATKQEMLAEAYRRGLLPPEKAAMYEEAQRRGLLGGEQPQQAEMPQQAGMPQPAPEQPVDFSASQMVQNIPGSAAQFASDIAQPVMHPVETAKGVGSAAMGVVDKLAHKLTQALPEDIVISGNKLNNWLADQGLPFKKVAERPEDMQFPQEKYADAIGQFFKDRYGSLDAFKKTAMNDPVGVLADASLALTGIGGAAKAVPAVSKAGAAIQKAGMAMEPVGLAMRGARGAVSAAIPKRLPQALYQSAAKFSTTFPKAKREALAQTALERGIMPTTRGLNKLENLTSNLGNRIDDLISAATAEGKTIPKQAIYRHLKDVRQQLGGPTVEGASDLRRINRIAKSFDEHLKKLGKDYLTPEELQRFKQDAYKRINFERRQGRARLADEETRKAMARAAKESVEQAAPGVKDINAEIGKLLDLQEPLQRSASRIENTNFIPINAPLNIGAGGAAGNLPGAVAGTGASIMELPRVKAYMALLAHQLQQPGAGPRAIPTATRQGLFQLGRMQDFQ